MSKPTPEPHIAPTPVPADDEDMPLHEAQAVLDALVKGRKELGNPKLRTPKERLAIGLVCLNKNVLGQSQRSIATELGISLSSVNRYIAQALETFPPPVVANARNVMLEQVDVMLNTFIPVAQGGDVAAAGVVAKYLDQKSKLTGAYAPIETVVTHREETEQEKELRALVEAANAENAKTIAAMTPVSETEEQESQ